MKGPAGATCQCLDRRQKELIPSIWSPSKNRHYTFKQKHCFIFSFFTCFLFVLFCLFLIYYFEYFQNHFLYVVYFLYFFHFFYCFFNCFYFFILFIFFSFFRCFYYYIFFNSFYFYMFFHFFMFFFYFIIFFVYFSLCFPYFRGNSLTSRADLEFKEFRLSSTMIFQEKLKFSGFFEKSSWKKKRSLGFLKKNIDFQSLFFFNHRGKKSKFLKFKVSPWIWGISAEIRKT